MKSALTKIFFAASGAFLSLQAIAETWEISTWTYNNFGSRKKSFTYAVNYAKDGDILELQKNLTVSADVEVYNDITVCSKPGSTYTISNQGRYYICNIHPGAKLTLTNVIVDCKNVTRREDLFNLNKMEISGSTTNIARLVLNDDAVIRNVYLSSLSGNENAAIHVKEGAILRINKGALIENCNNQSEPGKGGAICCDYGTIIMTGGTITGCNSKSAGGAIHTDGTRIDAVDVQGISARGDIYISGGYITNNTCAAGSHGGAIYLGNSGPMIHITGNPVISNNFSGAGTDAVPDDISTFELADMYANRLKLTGHSSVNPSGFTTNGIKFTGWVGVRYPLNNDDPRNIRFGGQWEYFNGTQEEPRQFFWNGNNSYRGYLSGNALIWSKHFTYELPLDGEKIADLIESGEESPLYIELDGDYEMTKPVYVPENYEIVIDLQGFELKCDFHVENSTGKVRIRDSSLMKSGKVTGHRTSSSPTAFTLEGGSYHTYPPPEWIATNRVLISNYCEIHPYMVASLAWETNATVKVSDLTKVPLSQVDNEVRVVTSEEDIADITFSTGDWVNMMHTNRKYKVQVFAAPAISNTTDGILEEVGERILLFDSDKGINSSDHITDGKSSNDANEVSFGREDSFSWAVKTYGLIKQIHVTLHEQGETYSTNKVEISYFKFPDGEFEATQRKIQGKLPFQMSDALLASAFGFNRAASISVQDMNTRLDTIQPNGLRKWENLVTGTEDDQLLLSTAEETTGEAYLKIALSDDSKQSRGDTGYSVWYDLRKSSDDGWVRIGNIAQKPNFEIALLDENGKSVNASGFYRVTTLIVPDADISVTNEIPSTNIVGVLEVASSLTNTLTAVPWVSLATDPKQAEETPVTISNYVNTSHLKHSDSLQVANKGHIYKRWEWNRGGKKWNGAITVTRDAVYDAVEADTFHLSRNSAIWVSRNDPAAKPFFLIGQYSATSVTLEIEAGDDGNSVCTLVPNPSMTAFKINDYDWNGNPGEFDIIRIPNEGDAPLTLSWNGLEWGKIEKIPGSRNGAWKNDYQIPAGTGFWYMRKQGDGFSITLPKSTPAVE